MKKLLLLVTLICAVSFLGGCSITRMFSEKGRNVNQALSYYGKKHYDESILLLADTLDQNPDYKDAYENLNEKFPKVQTFHLNNIERLEKSDDTDKTSKIAAEYEGLFLINRKVENLISSAKSKIKFKTMEVLPLKEKTVSFYYEAGRKYSEKNDREYKKTAAKMYGKAAYYSPEYRDAKAKYEEYKDMAMQRVMINLTETQFQSNIDVGALIYDSVQSSIVNSKSVSEYTKVISREQIQNLLKEQKLALEGIIDPNTAAQVGKTLGANMVIDISITGVSYSETDPVRTSTNKTWEEVVGQTTEYDSKTKTYVKKDVKQTRYYTQINYSKENSLILSVSYSIKDIETSQILKSDTFSQEASDRAMWTKYSGDAPKKSRNETEPSLSSKSELITKCADKVSKKISSSIIDYLD